MLIHFEEKEGVKCTLVRNQPVRRRICAFGIPSRGAEMPILCKVEKMQKCKFSTNKKNVKTCDNLFFDFSDQELAIKMGDRPRGELSLMMVRSRVVSC